MHFIRPLLFALATLFLPLNAPALAQALSLSVEVVLVEDVGATFETVPLLNTYSNPVVVCTYNLPSSADNDATVRVTNVQSTSFQVRVQQFEDSSAITPSDVHCLVAEEGIHTLSDGRVIEARTVLSTVTAGQNVGWTTANFTDVTSLVTGGHSSLIILGQVMSFNDNRASAFVSMSCGGRQIPASLGDICVAKNIGEINNTRLDETLGFIITEPGTGTVNDVEYIFGVTGNGIRGVGDNPPYAYSISGDFDIGVVTLNAMNRQNGGWAVLYGQDPLPANSIRLAIDEETVAGDSSRKHGTEEVNHAVFRNNQTANLNVGKTAAVSGESSSSFAIPGGDLLYTLNVENTGSAPLDQDSIFLVDTLPDEVSFYNDDIDGAGPETGVVQFTALSSGLTFTEATDLAFSDSATKPADFSACTYTPSAGYDAAVKHICLAPKGRFRAGSLQPDTEFILSFRAGIE